MKVNIFFPRSGLDIGHGVEDFINIAKMKPPLNLFNITTEVMAEDYLEPSVQVKDSDLEKAKFLKQFLLKEYPRLQVYCYYE